ncbi:MAG: hypothetical protein A3F70_03705 [Acidobacteria bacterium RIFCSPLOWO2_12_FULL_67_14]|nr:MAG: hypothetical protein A3H29_15935 [Acidobacteria bacterium RIFCSPLOWO2_02_FULL_67_21]OFW40102.1 MAG: hypothetical protein A3F70_03705 [Acidobacteria bacterium RIFCSPLOWO2_12_FULL_67_14]
MTDATVILGLLAALVWLLLASLHMRAAVWLLLLWIPVQGWFQLNVFDDSNLSVLIYEFQMVGLYLIFGVRALNAPGQFGPPSMIRFAIPFVIWALLLVPYSVYETGLLPTLIGLRTFLLPLPLVWIGYRAFTTRRELESVTSLIALQLVLIAGLTVWQFTRVSSMSGAIFETPLGYTTPGDIIRPPGTFSHVGSLGSYILFSVPFTIGLLGMSAALWNRVCFVLGLAGTTIALVVNTQRAAIVLLALTLPLMVVLTRRGRAVTKMAVAVCVMAAAGWLVADVAGDAFGRRVASISEDLNRTLYENPTLTLIDALRTPILGSGLGIASPGVGRVEGPANPSVWGGRAESIKWGEYFIAALVYETGVPGLVLFYLFLAAITYYSLKALRACRGTDMELLAAALLAFQLAILIYSWPYSPLRTLPARVLYWFWAGVLLSLPRLAAAKPAVQESIAARRTPADRMAALITERRAQPHASGAQRRVG